MKKTLFVSITMLLVLGLASCNVFDWMEPTTDHFDRCKGLNDKGDYDAAISECDKADPDDENVEVQLELADAHLAALGIKIDALSDVFLNASTGTDTIVALAESLIAAGALTIENHDDSIIHATEAFNAFENYGTLLIAQDATDGPTVAAFYNTLAGVSVVAVTMAYADIMATVPNGEVDKGDICNPTNVSCTAAAVHMCINDPTDPFYTATTCEGMLPSDAGVAADALIALGENLSHLDLPNLEEAVNTMANFTIPDPVKGMVKIKDSAYKPDAGRDILRSIAR